MFLEVGMKGSQLKWSVGPNLSSPSRVAWLHAESAILNTLCVHTPEISSLWSSGRLYTAALVNLQVGLFASPLFPGLCCCTPLQLLIGRVLALQRTAQPKENQGLGEFPKPALEMLRQHTV